MKKETTFLGSPIEDYLQANLSNEFKREALVRLYLKRSSYFEVQAKETTNKRKHNTYLLLSSRERGRATEATTTTTTTTVDKQYKDEIIWRLEKHLNTLIK